MDVLSDAITAMRTGQPHASHRRRAAPWGMRFPSGDGIGFHAVLRGSVWLHPPGGGEPVRLDPGDVVLLPGGRSYGIADAPDTELRPADLGPDGRLRPQPPQADLDDTLTSSTLCGAYLLNPTRPHPLLADLPPVLRLSTRDGQHPALRSVIDLLDAELTRCPARLRRGGPRPARHPAALPAARLVRGPVRRAPGTAGPPPSRDPAVSAALHALHTDPAHAWTVGELGVRAGLSRAAFARRFTALVGQPPLTYLTWWRMTTAGRLLRDTDAPLRVVAARSG